MLFTIFVFVVCEPLIPVPMYPAAKSSFLVSAGNRCLRWGDDYDDARCSPDFISKCKAAAFGTIETV